MNIGSISGFRPFFKAEYNKYKTSKPHTFETSKTNQQKSVSTYECDKQNAKVYAQFLQNHAQLLKEEGEELYEYYANILNDADDIKFNPNLMANYDKNTKAWQIKTLDKNGNLASWMLYDSKNKNMAIGNLANRKPIFYSFNNGKPDEINQKNSLLAGDIKIVYSSNTDKNYTIVIPNDEGEDGFSCKFVDDKLTYASENKPIRDNFGCIFKHEKQEYTY